ncbi:ABC transporter [candidate division WWE3 bacterium RIFOXYC1_FULL_40_10]|uniref:ABC transporter n=1 Tax=candidate division WWE3 bacterium RIFOXYA2_FULL_46_9 TaxID=1802636 RepID=A0A1F4W2Y7_UNCKA|nr:MAG: ABC transporter [candidate division WWE3 bacterium RIFOXYB1_FULL_40_22]OGC61470.1 MAG: ABC transporter [candidate division WWE3 bacterium RIFOXYA1_FULL_40_11]OGC63403.1 MAG: ABC transporter [candidate division WWE3 bacterium RIFOXYA2_FULL_46_9]OGC64566.1 MAG: ABC transporter [candidate division WWE3 bacterium RIFOXYB2_FULL_41_6]OGC65853.1 MAG: ABC transporter [candidate division WWE3 bacterium RIFOXYC1_FULL_40_10]OGC67390.1 MAG: ABC transporter [candidate division WWE3 bacterium RIFOXY
MSTTIKVSNLTKNFKTYKKQPGLAGSFKALFKREYKTISAVKSLNLEIAQGELVGFIGPNGAGKTTTLKMLSGLLYPSSGAAQVLGFTPFDRKNEFLKQISLVMGQKNQLWWDLPAIETFNLNKEIYEINDKDYKETLEELTELLDVKEVMHQQVRKMSLGQRMKCELIASLLHRPKVLFLDEPTIGLDVVMQKKVREFIKEYNKKYNSTVILTSHYMDDVKEICDRVIIINEGTLAFDGALKQLTKDYADYKILIPIFNSAVTKPELEELGEVVEFDHPRAVIKVPRDRVASVAGRVLEKYDVDDLDINEPKLEDVIRQIFEKPSSLI